MKGIRRLVVSLSLSALCGVCMAGETPAFPGGDEALQAYLTENMQYPAIARSNGIEGVVEVSFTVKADGSIGAIKISRMIDPELEAEAIRLVKKMPAWIPADKGGKAVDSEAMLKIPFILE